MGTNWSAIKKEKSEKTMKKIHIQNNWSESNNRIRVPVIPAALVAVTAEKYMMNLRENNEKCFFFWSNNRKYFSNQKTQKKSGCKNMGVNVSRKEKIISQRHNNSVFYALCKGHLFSFICSFFYPLLDEYCFLFFVRFVSYLFLHFFLWGIFFLPFVCVFDCCWWTVIFTISC